MSFSSQQQFSLNNILEVELYKHYGGKQSPFRLDMKFKALPGVTVLLGHSGAGKSTALRCIAGLSDMQKGRIVIGGTVLFDSRQGINVEPAHRRVAFVFQDLALFPHLDVLENVGYGIRRLKPAEKEERIAKIFNSFQIGHLRNRLPREISGGEQQRVALARALVTEPSFLLLDEPLSSLDIATKAGIIEDLRAWNETRRIPVLYVTHNYEEVFALGDHVITLEEGRIVAQGPPLEALPVRRRETMMQLAGFENILDAIVVGAEENRGLMACRLIGTSLDIQTSLTRVAVGTQIHVGIRADEILLASTPTKLIGPCNLMRGRVKRVSNSGPRIEVVVDGGVEFRVHVPADFLDAARMQPGDEAWMIIPFHSCHLIHKRRLRASQRLLVFVCNRNTTRSPIVQALCNAEIARRLGVPLEALNAVGVRAVSAGLSARPGESMAAGARHALEQLRVPVFDHSSQELTPELVAKAELIYCMTEAQRRRMIKAFPGSSMKTRCLCPGTDLEGPDESSAEGFLLWTKQVQGITSELVDQIVSSEPRVSRGTDSDVSFPLSA